MTHIDLPFTGKTAANYSNGRRNPYAYPLDDSGACGATLTWACPTPDVAAALEAVFAGRLADVPSRAAFTPGRGADNDDVRMCIECDAKPARAHTTRCAACERAGVNAAREAGEWVLAKMIAGAAS